MSNTRCDHCFVVTKLSQHLPNPSKVHMNLARSVLRYIKGTLDYNFTIKKSDENLNVLKYGNSEWGSSDDRKGPFTHARKNTRREKHAQPRADIQTTCFYSHGADFSRGGNITLDVERLSAKNAARKSRPTVAYNVFKWYLSHRRVFPAVSQI